MDNKNPSYKKVAEDLAAYIAKNWHFCPIDSEIGVEECQGWNYNCKSCTKCIVKHSEDICSKS